MKRTVIAVSKPVYAVIIERASVTTDFNLVFDGSIVLVNPITPAAGDWLAENIGDDAQFFGSALVVEPRYSQALVEGIERDGLTVSLR